MKIGLFTVSRKKLVLILSILLLSVIFLPLPKYNELCNYPTQAPSGALPTGIRCQTSWIWSRPLFLKLIDHLTVSLEPSKAYEEYKHSYIFERIICSLKRGTWGTWGLYPREYCQVPASDAGKACTDGSQCSLGSCLSQNGKLIGVCQTYPGQFGCFQYLNTGTLSGTFCVD